MEMLEEIAKADASTAWCVGQCSVVAMTAAYLDADVAHQVFGKPNDIMAWGAIAHDVQAVPGGYTISARWDFASGSRQANWLGAHVQVLEADGTRRMRPNGTPEIRTIVFPTSSATMYDVWNVIGLSGTGTDSYSVENLFIPDNFAALRDDFSALREKGPLYGITTYTMFGLGFGAVSLGVARATLDAAIDLARKKHSVGIAAMKDNSAVQGLIGRTEAKLRAARAYHFSTAARGLAGIAEYRRALRARPGGHSSFRDLDHPPGNRNRRYRLSHGRRHGGIQIESLRAAVPRHARHRAADPGPRHAL